MFLRSTLSYMFCIAVAGQRIMHSTGSVFHRPGLLLLIESCQVGDPYSKKLGQCECSHDFFVSVAKDRADESGKDLCDAGFPD